MTTDASLLPPARFVPGKSYVHGWIGDADLKTVYAVLARTEKQVTIQQGLRGPKRVTVKVVDGAECCRPNGRYSMAPTLRADRPAQVTDQAPAYLCLQCMEWTPDPHAICEDCRKAGYINSQTESVASQPTSESVDPAEALKSFSVFSRLLGLAYLASPEGSREEERLMEALEDYLGGEERAEELLGLLPQEAGDGISAGDVRLAFPIAPLQLFSLHGLTPYLCLRYPLNMETATSSVPHSLCPLVHDSAPACTCGGVHLGPYAGSHLPGCPKLGGRRGITEAEHSLMRHCDMFGSDGWPIRKQGRNWTWGTDGVPGPSVVFKTKREAVASFQAFVGILRDAVAGRI